MKGDSTKPNVMSLNHVFTTDWETFCRSLWRKYPTSRLSMVKSERVVGIDMEDGDLVIKKIKESEMLGSKAVTMSTFHFKADSKQILFHEGFIGGSPRFRRVAKLINPEEWGFYRYEEPNKVLYTKIVHDTLFPKFLIKKSFAAAACWLGKRFGKVDAC